MNKYKISGDKEFNKKMVDLYDYLADRNMTGGEVHFQDGIIFRCEIDITNWINKPEIPVIDFQKARVRNDKKGKRKSYGCTKDVSAYYCYARGRME